MTDRETITTESAKSGDVISKQNKVNLGLGHVIVMLDHDNSENPQVGIIDNRTGEYLAEIDGLAATGAFKMIVSHLEGC